MPAFTFEKISPPVRASAASPSAVAAKSSKPASGSSRALINQMLDRLAIARLRRAQVDLPPTLPRKPPPD